MSILILFLDGVGLGEADASINPFARVPTPTLERLLGSPLVSRGPGEGDVIERDGALLVPVDATLGVPGLPQSATGQTALLTGVNAPAAVGRHISAYPTAPLRELLATESLFLKATRSGRRVALANTYTPEYFEAIEMRRLRMAAVTYAAQAARVRLRTLDDLRAGRSIFHDLTNGRLRQWGHDVPELTPQESGRRLGALAAAEDLTFFEFFLTDLAAHRRAALAADEVVAMVDALLAGVLDVLDGRLTVLVTSDHGNLEDDRSPLHTTNLVPVLAVGPDRAAFRRVRAITDIAPAVLAVLDRAPDIVRTDGPR